MICASRSGTRWLGSSLASAVCLLAFTAAPEGAPKNGWSRILAAVGLDLVPGPVSLTILEADSAAAQALGFRPTAKTVRVAAVKELLDPQLEVLWEKPVNVAVYDLPDGARAFTRERHTGAPLAAGLRRGNQAVLWTATGVGEKGYERFPYLLQALAALGVEFPFRGARTWAFFDSSYRLRADPDFLARRWRQAGIAALHVAAWHFHEPDHGRDEYLKKLIRACHARGILVYAWLELPHVSESFWDQNPHCREKTAILQDAHLDWRKLMNLADPACSRAAEEGLRALLDRFDWDGVNLAELYFESLHGPHDPQRFTPMSQAVREEFERLAGFDPLALFRPDSPRYWRADSAAWGRFVTYRAGLALRLQARFLEAIRGWRGDLDLALTHIDDQFDARMREYLGADAAAVLPLLERFDFTFVVEDPSTIWHLGPDRYPQIARRYRALTPRQDRLAVDINIVERHQNVYPTKKQTGTELFQLVSLAGASFARVLLYFEQSVARADYDLLAAASAAVVRAEPMSPAGRSPGGLLVEALQTAGVRWKGPLRVNGRPWPANDGSTAWIPAGRHRLEPDARQAPLRLVQINADLLDARVVEDGLEFRYRSSSRALALLDRRPGQIRIDGQRIDPLLIPADEHFTLRLPSGTRTVRVSLPPG